MTGRAAVLALVVAVLLVSYAYPLRTWYDQHNERNALEREKAQLEEQVAEYEKELELWDDPAYVATQARERLGFVMPGEQGYVVIRPDSEDSQEQTGPEGLPPAGDGEWHERLWASVQAADEGPDDGDPGEKAADDGGPKNDGSDGDGAESDDADSGEPEGEEEQ